MEDWELFADPREIERRKAERKRAALPAEVSSCMAGVVEVVHAASFADLLSKYETVVVCTLHHRCRMRCSSNMSPSMVFSEAPSLRTSSLLQCWCCPVCSILPSTASSTEC